MRSRWAVRLACCVLTDAVAAAALPTSTEAPRRASLTSRDAAAVERARDDATRRLENASCRKVFSDFHDVLGRTMERDLESWAMGPAEYLRMLPFVDGSGEPLCHRSNVMLVSTPGVPRVIVCPGFARLQRSEPGAAANRVIHELLHTLGLGENPPTSGEITRRVEIRCGW